MSTSLLRIEDLTVEFAAESRRFRAVDGLSLAVDTGETVGLVGESGSGKTVTALSIMRLMDARAEIVNGQIWFRGRTCCGKQKRRCVACAGGKSPWSSRNR